MSGQSIASESELKAHPAVRVRVFEELTRQGGFSGEDLSSKTGKSTGGSAKFATVN